MHIFSSFHYIVKSCAIKVNDILLFGTNLWRFQEWDNAINDASIKQLKQ